MKLSVISAKIVSPNVHPKSVLKHCFLLLAILLLPHLTQAREIVDMGNNKVTLPDTISKAVAASPPGTYLLYAIDPHLVAGLNFPLWESEKKYTIPEYRNLPVIGGMVGQGRTMNREVLLLVKPDFVVYWAWSNDATNDKFKDSLSSLPFPLVSVRLDSIEDYPAALRFMGDITHHEERGEELSRYAITAINEAKKISAAIPENKKVTVYYAEGLDGLSTERANSMHVELIPLAGGINVHQGKELDHYGMEKISMEQLLVYNPMVILVKEKAFFDQVYNDSRWKNVRAVQEKQVYLIPADPFNWFDRPPSFMRLLGIKWMLNLLHPDIYSIDLITETRAFYKLFLGVELNDAQAREVLNR
jgi:iron complex transport system substrate-binding protein